MYASRYFKHYLMPISNKAEVCIVSVEYVDDEVVLVFYCRGIAERIEVTSFNEKQISYPVGQVPFEYEGIFNRLKMNFDFVDEFPFLEYTIGSIKE